MGPAARQPHDFPAGSPLHYSGWFQVADAPKPALWRRRVKLAPVIWQARIRADSLLPIAGGIYPDLDLAGLGFLAFGQVHRQHAILILRVNGFGVYRSRQREAAAEGSISALHVQVIVFRDVLLEFAFPSDGEQIVFDANVDGFLIHVGQVCLTTSSLGVS